MRKYLFLICFFVNMCSFLYADEFIDTSVDHKDYLAFNNFKSDVFGGRGGNCYAMANFVAESDYLLNFNPHLPRMSEPEVLGALESAFCSKIPVTISGFESLEELSKTHESVLKKFLEKPQWDLNIEKLIKGYLLGCYPISSVKAEDRNLVHSDRVAQEILKKLKLGDSVVLSVDGTPYDDKDYTNHAVLVTGAKVTNGEIVFFIYDPNEPHGDTIIYQNGQFFYAGFPTAVLIFYGDVKRLEKSRSLSQNMLAKRHAIESQLKKTVNAIGTIESAGLFLGRKSTYTLQFEDANPLPIKSSRYDLNKLQGKNVAIESSFQIEKNDAGTHVIPIVNIDRMYEITSEKRIPQKPQERQKYLHVGTFESRGNLIGQKGSFQVKENGQIKYVLKAYTPQILNRLKSLDGQQDVGIIGNVTADTERGIPIIEVIAIDDFKVEVYKEIPPNR